MLPVEQVLRNLLTLDYCKCGVRKIHLEARRSCLNLLKKLRGTDHFATFGFPDCGEKFGLLFRSEFKGLIAFLRQHRYDCAFGQALALQLNRAVVNFASGN